MLIRSRKKWGQASTRKEEKKKDSAGSSYSTGAAAEIGVSFIEHWPLKTGIHSWNRLAGFDATPHTSI